MSLERAALDTAETLKSLLANEVASAQQTRDYLKCLDGVKLLDRATQRERFNVDAKKYAAVLEEMLGALPSPRPEPLAGVLCEIRALSSSLRELDAFHQEVGSRALSCVRGYLRSVAAPPAAYDKNGAQMSSERSTVSQRF